MTTHTDLIARLRVIANAIADGNYSELTMRIPAEPDRDADIVVMRSALALESLEQQVAALTKERNALQDKLNAVVTVGIREREQLVAAQAREAKLQGKLFHFGRHHSNCGWQMNRPCNCGFDEALANPATIPELCALLEKAEEALDKYRGQVDRFGEHTSVEALAAIKQRKEKADAIRGLA